jgi:hypothetical protein
MTQCWPIPHVRLQLPQAVQALRVSHNGFHYCTFNPSATNRRTTSDNLTPSLAALTSKAALCASVSITDTLAPICFFGGIIEPLILPGLPALDMNTI